MNTDFQRSLHGIRQFSTLAVPELLLVMYQWEKATSVQSENMIELKSGLWGLDSACGGFMIQNFSEQMRVWMSLVCLTCVCGKSWDAVSLVTHQKKRTQGLWACPDSWGWNIQISALWCADVIIFWHAKGIILWHKVIIHCDWNLAYTLQLKQVICSTHGTSWRCFFKRMKKTVRKKKKRGG